MKIDQVQLDNRRRQFIVTADGRELVFPYAKLVEPPTISNRITDVYVDEDLGNEALTYCLGDGTEGTVHLDHVLEYNRDPQYMADLLLYKLTLEAQEHLKSSGLSNREVIRRLGTSASQYYRLLDQTNYSKSIHQMLSLLKVLGCEVDVVVRDRSAQGKHRVLVSV
ncbi:MAG: hypothetical protein ABIH23_19635 [bacterium]